MQSTIRTCLLCSVLNGMQLCDLVAQLVEHLTFNQRVAGSSPAQITTAHSFRLDCSNYSE
jgi:hypothetical protein